MRSTMGSRSDVVVAFDVYGTLVDTDGMIGPLRGAFGSRAPAAAKLWREKQVEYSFRRALMRKYETFDVCTAQALMFVAEQMGVELDDECVRSLLSAYGQLSAFADAADALTALQAAGRTCVAFTNGAEASVRELLRAANLLQKIESVISSESVRTFKPDPAIYEYLTRRVSAASPGQIWLVSANAWDVIGAAECGLNTIWLRRSLSRIFDPWGVKPTRIVASLAEIDAALSGR